MINYISAKSDAILKIYFNGHGGAGFFPLQTYLIFIKFYVLKMNTDKKMIIYESLDDQIKVNEILIN